MVIANKNKWYFFLKILGLLSLLYIPIFGHLGSLPIRVWDEARQAINAFEMLHNHNYIVAYFNDLPDLFNTKPPLLIWFQVCWMKILGPTELAVRLPSAIAALLTCLAILVFAIKYLKSFSFAFIAIIVLITTQGYIGHHAVRTGDYDSLLTCFMTISSLLFFMYVETKKNSYLYFFFLNITLAVLTKSIAGLFFIPAIIIYSLYFKQAVNILKNKHFYIGLISFSLIVFGYYYLREISSVGFWSAVKSNEFGGRFFSGSNGHVHDFWFYCTNLKNIQLSDWYLLIPCGIVLGWLSKNEQLKKVTIFSTLIVVCTLLVISSSKTKLIWYTVPLFPFLAILIAVFIHIIYVYLKQLKEVKEILTYNIFSIIFVFLIIVVPYQKIVTKTFRPIENDAEFYALSYYLKDVIDGKENIGNYAIAYQGYKAHIDFYLNILESKGIDILTKDVSKLKTGDNVITNQKESKEFIESHYNFDKEIQSEFVVKYKIK